MPTKKGGGGKSQNYNADNGRFSKENKSSVSGRNETLANALNIYTNTQKNPSVTKKEWRLWYDAIADIKRGMYVPKRNGKKLIVIGNKIFFTSGTYAKPKLEKILEFDSWEDVERFLNDE